MITVSSCHLSKSHIVPIADPWTQEHVLQPQLEPYSPPPRADGSRIVSAAAPKKPLRTSTVKHRRAAFDANWINHCFDIRILIIVELEEPIHMMRVTELLLPREAICRASAPAAMATHTCFYCVGVGCVHPSLVALDYVCRRDAVR